MEEDKDKGKIGEKAEGVWMASQKTANPYYEATLGYYVVSRTCFLQEKTNTETGQNICISS